MEARGNVRWDGTFKCPLTPSAARDTANRVVRWRKNRTPRFCASEMAKKKIRGRSHQRVRGNILILFHVTSSVLIYVCHPYCHKYTDSHIKRLSFLLRHPADSFVLSDFDTFLAISRPYTLKVTCIELLIQLPDVYWGCDFFGSVAYTHIRIRTV